MTLTHTQIHAECDNPLDASSGSYTTRVLLGRRDDEILEVYARTLVKQRGQKCGLCLLRAPQHRPPSHGLQRRHSHCTLTIQVELMRKRGLVQPLLLTINIQSHSSQMFKAIMQEVDQKLLAHVTGAISSLTQPSTLNSGPGLPSGMAS